MSDDEQNKRLRALLRHIDNVRTNCVKLGGDLIDSGEELLGRSLIANGYRHDATKFSGIEWLYLNDETKSSDPMLFEAAKTQHYITNLHHPEAWIGGVHSMDRLHHAEMVCDWAARSSEFGTDLRAFMKDTATKRFEMPIQGKTYRQIKELVDMLLDAPFK